MSPSATVISGDGEKTVALAADASLLESLQSAGIALPAVCGGRGVCLKCAVQFVSGAPEPCAADRLRFSEGQLDEGFRLACKSCPADGAEIRIPDESGLAAVNSFELDGSAADSLCARVAPLARTSQSFASQACGGGPVPLGLLEQCSELAESRGGTAYVYEYKGRAARVSATPRDCYAIGVDIGTTTIGFVLLALGDGRAVDSLSAVNGQRSFGADVISRIQRANGGDLPLLAGSARRQVREGAAELCRRNSVEPGDVLRIAIAANTTMLHLLLGLSCAAIGQYPFTPVGIAPVSFRYSEAFEGPFSCNVDILPCVSAYIGADIVAGALFSGIHRSERPAILLDIGTNGEMALAADGRLVCAATAAGPAFEGGNILWGTGSVPGAISSAVCEGGRFKVGTIGGQPPIGICGSGVVDIAYEALKSGLISANGRFCGGHSATGIALAKAPDGQDIVFCQKDVRELQLGKSAIRSGLDSLLNHAGMGYGEIGALFIAGGFGSRLRLASGVGIGMIPEALAPKVALIGNSSLGGVAKYLLESGSEGELDRIIGMSSEFDLPGDGYFNKAFIENIDF
jgi:uncharacterized 2Fe-2S/4Fe-4S cluster protein (DUF4445 family)